MFVGIQPFSIYKNNIYFLIGQEKYEKGYKDSLKWSGFGGLKHENESYLQGALREGFEETMSMIGSIYELRKNVINKPIYYKNSCIYLIKIKYDKNLPNVFNNIYEYMKKAISFDNINEGYFEKCNIKWIKKTDLLDIYNEKSNNIILRKDYKKSLNYIFKEIDNIINT